MTTARDQAVLANQPRCPLQLSPLPTELRDAATGVGARMAALPKPLAAYLLSTLYTSMLPDAMRSALGVFYTPPALVERLLDLVEDAGIDWSQHRVVDPAAGGGAFVTPTAVRVANRLVASLRPHRGEISGRWFATDTREPIRDETLRNALQVVGAVIERPGLDTTSSTPRWALTASFADLFTCDAAYLPTRIDVWRAAHLSPQALARTALAQRGVAASGVATAVLVRFPNGETRRMSTGLSSEITRAVVEKFALRYLSDPGVLWISESRTQVVARDDELARRVGLDINRQEVLPDVILVDLGAPDPPLFVFVEVVATDGPVSEDRKRALLELVRAGGHDERNAAFITALWDRDRAEYRRVVGAVAWGSFVWCATEPDKIVVHRDTSGEEVRITDLLPPAGGGSTPLS